MKWHEFEDQMRNTVRQHETPVDTDALWERLQGPKRRRRALLLWWWWPLGVLLAGGMVYGWQQQHRTAPKYAAPVRAVQPTVSLPFERQPSPKDVQIVLATQVPPVPAAGGLRSTFLIKNEGVAVAPHAVKEQRRAAVEAQAVEGANEAQTLKGANEAQTLEETNQAQTLKGANEAQILPAVVTNPQISTSEPGKTGTDPDSTDRNILPPFGQIIPLPMVVPQLAPPAYPAISPVAMRRKNRWWLGLTTGATYWSIKRAALDSVLVDREIPFSRERERILEGLEWGLLAQTRIGGGWSLRSGLQYSQLTSVFEWEKTTIVQRDKSVTNFYINGNIDTLAQGIGFKEIRRNIRHYNRIRFFSVPLELRRGFTTGRMSIAPSVGGQLQWGQRARGMTDSLGIPVENAYAGIYQRSLSFAARGGVALSWPLGRHTLLSVEPHAIVDLSVRTRSGHVPAERFRQFGLRVGVWRRF